MAFKTIVFEIQVEDRREPIKRISKKDAIETARRTVKKYPNKAVRIIQIIKEYSEVDFTEGGVQTKRQKSEKRSKSSKAGRKLPK